MKKILAVFLCLLMVCSLVACTQAPAADPTPQPQEPPKTSEAPPPAQSEAPPAPAEDSNKADYTYVGEPGTHFDFNTYYNSKGVECEYSTRATGGTVEVPDIPTTVLPTPSKAYTIGFSVYYTVDEVGAMILDTMKGLAAQAGIELLVNDANYDQNAQNQAVEQWILQEVDAVILAPCDFYGVKAALDALQAANIPVIQLNPALAGQADTVYTFECVEQGEMAGKLLVDHLLANNVEMKGKVVFQTLPFVHPNAATRKLGFENAFKDYPDIEIVELTGTAPEEHYTAFEGALMNYGDELIGAFGLYSSATIGMMNAAKAANSNVPITSIDNDKVILEGIYNGDLLGSCCYSSTASPFWCMAAAISILEGIEVPGAYFGENINVTKDNVEAMFEHYYGGKTLADYMAGLVD